MTRRTVAMLAVVLVLASCAAPARQRWENPNLPPERWHEDQAACWSFASRRAQDSYALDEATGDPLNGQFGRSSFRTDMARYDAERLRNRLYGDCLSSRGYVPVKEGGK